MSYYLVCDAGGTQSNFMLFDRTGQVFAASRGGGGNALFMDNDTAVDNIYGGIAHCLKKAGLLIGQIEGLGLFIPGFAPCLPALSGKLGCSNISCQGDEESAFYSALASSCGIVMLCGTGSFAMGRDRQGSRAQAGGWGPLLGDFGSGYHVGLLCLQELTRLTDFGVENSLLQQLVLAHLGLQTTAELRTAAYRQGYDRSKISSLCPVVAAAAAAGDKAAVRILTCAAESTYHDVAAVASRLDSDGLTVSLTGGVCKTGSPFTDAFIQMIGNNFPGLTYQPPQLTPVQGAAVCLLHQKLGVEIDMQLLERLKADCTLDAV